MTPFRKHVFICTNRRDPQNPKGSCAHVGSEAICEAFTLPMPAIVTSRLYELSVNVAVTVRAAVMVTLHDSAVVQPEIGRAHV